MLLKPQVCPCRVSCQIALLLSIAVTCVYFCLPPPLRGKATCRTMSGAAAPVRQEYSRNHLLWAEPGCSTAAVAHGWCMLLGCTRLHTRHSCLVTRCQCERCEVPAVSCLAERLPVGLSVTLHVATLLWQMFDLLLIFAWRIDVII